MARYLSQIKESLGINEEKRKKHYVGIKNGKREVFTSHTTPTQETHGHLYNAVIGPFNTKGGAYVMAKAAGGNPHISSVHDAERIAKKNEEFNLDAQLDDIYDSEGLITEEEHSSDEHAKHELILHADNTSRLYHSSREPIMHNLAKHASRGKYDSEKARKLWGYHADRAAQDYHREHGSESHQKWHHMFSKDVRRAAAHHWEESNREEVHERAKKILADRAAKKASKKNSQP